MDVNLTMVGRVVVDSVGGEEVEEESEILIHFIEREDCRTCGCGVTTCRRV